MPAVNKITVNIPAAQNGELIICTNLLIRLWLSSFVCNSFSSLHFFWKYESKLKSTQVYKGEEHNLTLSLREIYPLVLTIELKEFELLEEF